MSGGYSTVYFRKTFTITDPSSISSLLLRGLVDDGINVWINGNHVASLNVGSENIAHTGTASGAIENPNFVDFPLTGVSSHLVAGTNVIAVQLLNANLAASSDAFFDADLTPITGGGNGPTPGARNASFASDAAPALRQVNHSPKQPSAGQAVDNTRHPLVGPPDRRSMWVSRIVVGCPASSFQVFFAGFSFRRMSHSWPKASPRELSNGVRPFLGLGVWVLS